MLPSRRRSEPSAWSGRYAALPHMGEARATSSARSFRALGTRGYHGASVKPIVILLAKAGPKPGLFATHGDYPVPVFGERCVCCSAPTDDTVSYDPSGDQQVAERLEVPCCDGCSEHLGRSHLAEQLAILALVVGGLGTLFMGGAAIVSGGEDVLLLGALACGIVPLSLGGAVLWLRDRRQRTLISSGHHPLEIRVELGRCVIHTTNATLAEELLALNPTARRLA
jgi:hypothetical protein